METDNIIRNFLSATSAQNSKPPEFVQPTLDNFAEGGEKTALPAPETLPDKLVNFLELSELRATVRQYSAEKLTREELSYLLWCTQGVKAILPNGITRRTVPSAGSRHVFDTFLYLQRVEGINAGLYRFLAEEHKLQFIAAKEDIADKFTASFKKFQMVQNSAVTFVWAANMSKMTAKFGARGYRYVFLDAGHVCQNLYLAGYTTSIGVCAMGEFFDNKLNDVLELDGTNRFAVYAATIGKM